MFNEHDDELFVFISRFVRVFFSLSDFCCCCFHLFENGHAWIVNLSHFELHVLFICRVMFSRLLLFRNCYRERFFVTLLCFAWNETKWHRVPRYQAPNIESQQWNDLQWINCLIVRLYIVRPMNVLNDPKIVGIIATVNVIKTVTHN